MGITRIDHVQLAMPAGQEERARAFYEGLLGIAWAENRSIWPGGVDAGSRMAR